MTSLLSRRRHGHGDTRPRRAAHTLGPSTIRGATPAVVLLCALALLLGALSFRLAWRPAPEVFKYPLFEDGYYSLTIARAIGAGQGPTVDGHHWTSGFQPLWVVLIAPLSTVVGGDREAFVRTVLIVHALVFLLCIWLVGLVAFRVASRWSTGPPMLAAAAAACLYASSPTILELHFNGLETGLTLALYLTVAVRLLSLDCASTAGAAKLGFWCGLLILSRVDTVFLVLLAMPVCCAGVPRVGWRRLLTSAFVVPATAFAVSAPWWLYNVAVFHHLMPQSGTAEADYGFYVGRLLTFAHLAVRTALPLPFAYALPDTALQPLAYALIVTAVGLGAAAIRAALRDPADRSLRVALLGGFNIALLATWYGLTSAAWWMYLRYSAPLLLLSVPLTVLACMRLFRERLQPLALTAIGLTAAAAGIFHLHLPGVLPTESPANYVQVELARRAIPSDVVVGALQTGTLGFFRDRVVNLDGKVNVEALARRADLDGYCRDAGIDWLVDVDWLIHRDVFHGSPAPSWWRTVAAAPVRDCAFCTVVAYSRVSSASGGPR